MYCLRVFSVVLQELHCLLVPYVYCKTHDNCIPILIGCCIREYFVEKHVYTKFHLDWLLCQ